MTPLAGSKKVQKSKLFFTIIIVCLLGVPSAKAQAYGFLGKKFSVGYYFILTPSLRNPNNLGTCSFPQGRELNTQVEKFLFSYNPIHQFSADYVAGRRLSIMGSVFFYKTKAYSSNAELMVDTTGLNNYTGETYAPVRLVSLSGTGFALGFKYFGSKYIAPFGNYFKTEFLFQEIKADFADIKFTDSQYTSSYIRLKPGTQVTNALSFSFSFGKQRIFANRFIVDTGMRFCLPLTLGGGNFRGNLYYDQEKYFRALSLNRVNGLNLLGFYLGISPLVF